MRFFGLKQEPFSLAPDPRYLYMSKRHREALAHLLYGVGGGGGFVLLSGEIGAGKTTVCRCFLEQIPQALQRRLHLQPQAHRDGAAEDDLRRVPHPAAARRRADATVKDLRRRAQRLPAADARGRPEQRADHRRGADALGRGARAAAPAHQPRDQRAQAAADRPDRPARAAHDARAARARAAGAARDRPLPPERALGQGDRAVHPPPPLGRRHDAGDAVRPQARCGASTRSRAACRAGSTCCATASCSAPTRTASQRSTWR